MNYIPEFAVPMLMPPAMTALPNGVLEWSDAGAVLIWFILMAFVGSLLGILREMASGASEFVPDGYVSDERLESAA